jgi:hypothetical protein
MWSKRLILGRIFRIFFVLTWCMYSGFYAHAQVNLKDAEICLGDIVDFDKLIPSQIIGVDDIEMANWYVNDVKMHSGPWGFTDTPTTTTVYTLHYTTDDWPVESSLTVTVYDPPILVIPDPDVTICSGGNVMLNAIVAHPTPFTEILWVYDGVNYSNGELLRPSSTGTHTVTATATNTPLCPQTSETLHITVNYKPTLANGVPGTVTHCTQEFINLNDCVGFFVYDTDATNERDTANYTTGTITWLHKEFTPVPDPEHVLLTSLDDTLFYADLSDITVYYSSTCTPSFQRGVESTFLTVPVNITSNYFHLDYDYDTMCYGDSVYAVFRLLDDEDSPSPCASILDLEVLSAHTPERKILTSPTERTLVFAPFTGLNDTIKVKVTGSLPGLEKIDMLYLRPPKNPSISSSIVCINTDTDFNVISDQCDTIRDVQCLTLNAASYTQIDNQLWKMHVPDGFAATTPFQCEVTYFSKLRNKDTVQVVNQTLRVWEDPPELLVFSMQGSNTYTPFDPAQNLCLGDSLLFVFHTPHDCDTIVDIKWLQNSGTLTLTHEDPHNHFFTIKPAREGDNIYRASILYKHPKGTINLSIDITYTVKVKQRPRLFINPNPPDTLTYCYPDDALNLNRPNPSADIINYNFIVPGPNAVNFLVPKAGGGGVDTLPSFQPQTTGNYVVEANYQYLCSEMDTTLARDEVRIVVNRKDEEPASFIQRPPKEGFCIIEGVTIESANKEGSSLTWEHNGKPIDNFPYFLQPGTYTLTALIYNACYPSSPNIHNELVRVVPVPMVEAMPDTTVCRGDSVVLKVTPGGFVGDKLIWSFTSGVLPIKDTVVIMTTTTFRANTGNVCGSVSDEVTVFRRPDASVYLMPDTSACLYDAVQLRVIQKEGDIVWSSSHFNIIGTGESTTVWVNGNETYTAIATNVCGKDSAELKVTALSLPYVKVITDTTICYGKDLNLTDCIIGESLGTLQWTPGYSANITEPVTYIATVTTPKCRSASDTMYVNVYKPLILLPDNSNLPRYNKMDFYDVSFETLQATPPLAYNISGTLPPGLTMANNRLYGQPALTPTDYNTHRLQVSVIDGHRCSISKEYLLTPEWKAPNVLLPTGDAGNALFLPDYNMEVYTRNGLLLYEGRGWDGMWNNAFVPAGTYFYKVQLLIDGMPEERMSFVVVMYY